MNSKEKMASLAFPIDNAAAHLYWPKRAHLSLPVPMNMEFLARSWPVTAPMSSTTARPPSDIRASELARIFDSPPLKSIAPNHLCNKGLLCSLPLAAAKAESTTKDATL